MIISAKSQLGLRFRELKVKQDFIGLMKNYLEGELGITESFIDRITNGNLEDFLQEEKELLKQRDDNNKIRDKVNTLIGENNIIDEINDNGSSFYFICDSVYKAAELVRITNNFSGRTLKDIKFGKYTYLMGMNEMIRFLCMPGAIRGFYYNDKDRKAFEFGIEIENGGYFFQKEYATEFSKIMQVLTFVELGDIEVQILESGTVKNKSKQLANMYNGTNKTIFVVDSSWNKIIIRTDGFAVRGHFRLQSCGEGKKDRKLIWIDAFEKHGYKRRPKAEISRD